MSFYRPWETIPGSSKVWEHKGITNETWQAVRTDNQQGRTFARSPAWASALLVPDEVGNARRLKVRDGRQVSNPRFFVTLSFLFSAVVGWRQAIGCANMANVFMAQTHFFFPFERVGNKAQKKLKERGKVIPIGFTSQRNEMLSRFVALEEQTFYYASRTKNNAECFRRILIKAYLVSFRLSNQDTEDFFLVAGTSIDKCFDESYVNALPNSPNQSFTERICTERDLAYLLAPQYYTKSIFPIARQNAVIPPMDRPHSTGFN